MINRDPGRGLQDLMNEAEDLKGSELIYLPVEEIQPNPQQPRNRFDAHNLEQLAESLKIDGLLQPIVVRDTGSGYEIIAGERRWRAAKMAELIRIPVLIREASTEQMLEVALIENLLREDLDPIEKARSFKALLEKNALTQEEAAKRVGLDRSSFANYIRLLDLPQEIQDLVSRGTLSMGHARALCGLKDRSRVSTLCRRMLQEELSVRQTEKLIQQANSPGKSPDATASRSAKPKPSHIRDLELRLMRALGTKVLIEEKRKGGKIIIEFYSPDDFERISEMICK